MVSEWRGSSTQHRRKSACYTIEVYLFLAKMASKWRGSIVGKKIMNEPILFFHHSRCVLRPSKGFFIRCTCSSFIFCPNISLWESVLSSQILERYQKEKWGTSIVKPVAPVAYRVILEPGIGQFREFEPRRVHTRTNSLGLFLVHKLTCGKRESVS